MKPIEMNVEPQNEYQYRVRYDAWHYREPRDDGKDKIFLANIPQSWLDILGFMVARKLVDEGGYGPMRRRLDGCARARDHEIAALKDHPVGDADLWRRRHLRRIVSRGVARNLDHCCVL